MIGKIFKILTGRLRRILDLNDDDTVYLLTIPVPDEDNHSYQWLKTQSTETFAMMLHDMTAAASATVADTWHNVEDDIIETTVEINRLTGNRDVIGVRQNALKQDRDELKIKHEPRELQTMVTWKTEKMWKIYDITLLNAMTPNKEDLARLLKDVSKALHKDTAIHCIDQRALKRHIKAVTRILRTL